MLLDAEVLVSEKSYHCVKSLLKIAGLYEVMTNYDDNG